MRRTFRCDGKLLSPKRRLRAGTVLQDREGASERLVCPVVGQHCSTQRHPAKFVSIEEGKLRHRLREIAVEHICWAAADGIPLPRREGWTVNHKPVQRLWREEDLQVTHSYEAQAGLAGGLHSAALSG